MKFPFFRSPQLQTTPQAMVALPPNRAGGAPTPPGHGFLGNILERGTALSVATVFACVRILGDTMAQLPMKLRKSVKGGGSEPAEDHAIARLLKFPNPFMTGYDFRRTMGANQALHGYACAIIVRDQLGRPQQLWPIHSSKITPAWQNGQLLFRAGAKTYAFSDILHLKGGITLDGAHVTGGCEGAANAITLAKTIDERIAAFEENGAMPGFALTTTVGQGLSADQEAKLLEALRQRMDSMVSGKFRPFILRPGMGITPIDTKAARSDTDRKSVDISICAAFGVPPSKLGIEAGSYSNPEHAQLDFNASTLGTIASNWEAAFSGALLGDDKFTHFFKVTFAALAKTDLSARASFYAIGKQNGFLSANDIRALEDMEPVEGGDSYMEPLNMVKAGSGATGNPGTQTTRQGADTPNRLAAFLNTPAYSASADTEHFQGLARHNDRLAKISPRWANAQRVEVRNDANPNELRIFRGIGENYWDATKSITATSVATWLDTQKGDIVVVINSPGGDVFEGQAIHNLLKDYGAQGHAVTVRVIALAASAASLIAMAGSEIEMAGNAQMMIHEAWTYAAGNKNDLAKEIEALTRIDSGLVSAYAATNRAKLTVEEITALLEAETWLTAQEALEKGFCDRIGGETPIPPAPEPFKEPSLADLTSRFSAAQGRHKKRLTLNPRN